ncbi:GNAT family N-acetyltransferase [uncultured Pontibacter sp.]|uniref:GNAT family N-acetyltransferase n=1 Tax=uncultured Pontibacter sp. TaxID=453356 RepID=UPI00261FE898|nr:GNAT family N-acetyltransferase [uncultured Pontibacter sp.]
MIKLRRTNSDDPDFRPLVALLDQDLRIRDGEDHAFYAQYNTLDTIKHVVVAYQKDESVGCGAIKAYDDTTAEVKRMFVLEQQRGQGIASLVLAELEQWASALGYTSCILETGTKQPEAIALYRKCGYTVIQNYGQYAGVENSVCMQKKV